METRSARADDLAALHEIFRAAVGELFRRHSFAPPDPPREAFVAQHGHLLAHDASRFWVAERSGRPVGFAAAFVRGDTWFLSALFVEPAEQAAGIGKELLALAWDPGGQGIRRRLTIVDAIQPVSTGLYSRAGLLPQTPLLTLAGEPVGSHPPDLEPGPVEDGALAELDRRAYGFDRAVDHSFWRREAEPTLWRRDGKPVAYSYRWPSGRIGPVGGRTAEAAGDALSAELASAAGERVSVVVPGAARPALAAALAAGLRYSDPPGLVLASDPVDLAALVPYGYSLF